MFLPSLGASLLYSGIVLAQDTTGATGSETLSTIQVEGESALETATSPVDGYTAKRTRSATKTDTSIAETPQSISVIAADQIQAQNARDIRQVLRYVSGVVPELRGNVASRYDQLTLRGFQPDTYLDGLKQLGYFYTIPKTDPYLLERVEVIKGPASVLYGQTPPGGLINLVSKRPTEDQTNEFYLETGNDSRLGAGFDIGGTLDEEGDALYRVVATGSQRNGPQETVETSNFSIAPSLTLRLSDATELTLLAKYRNDPDSGSYGALPYQGTVDPLNDGSKLARDFYDGDKNFESFDRKTVQLGYEFSHWFNDNLQFRQNFRFRDAEVDYRSVYGSGLSADQTTLNRGTAASQENVNGILVDNQLLGYVDTGPVKHTLLGGFDYQNLDADRYYGLGRPGTATAPPPLSLDNPDHDQTIPEIERNRFEFDQDQIGFYLQDQAKIGRLTMLAGGRYDVIDTTALGPDGSNRDTRTDRAFTGRLGTLYTFDNGIAPFLSYTESFQSPATSGTRNDVLDPTEGEQYEGGVKFQPPGTNTLVTLSAFELKQTNVTGSLQPDGTRSQTGEVRVRGLELDTKASLANGLDISLAAAYLDSEITSADDNTEGNEYQRTPDYTASVWLDYTQPTGAWKGAGGGIGVRYVGEQQVSNDNENQVPDYTVADAALHYELGGLDPAYEGWRVGLNMQNVFDKKYVASCLSSNFCYFGYGRETTATVSYRWQ